MEQKFGLQHRRDYRQQAGGGAKRNTCYQPHTQYKPRRGDRMPTAVLCHPVGVDVPVNATSRGFTPACVLVRPSAFQQRIAILLLRPCIPSVAAS